MTRKQFEYLTPLLRSHGLTAREEQPNRWAVYLDSAQLHDSLTVKELITWLHGFDAGYTAGYDNASTQ